MVRRILSTPLLVFIFLLLGASIQKEPRYTHYLEGSQQWVDSVFNSLSEDERLGQLFMVAAYSNKGPEHKKEIDNLIENYHIGGLIFFQGGPLRQAKLLNHYQSISKVPLFVAMDAEWGLGMRLDSTISFPRQIALGAIKDDAIIYEMGEEVAYQCQRMGMQINFAPVVDINFNPKNPVIGTRSFGENIIKVTEKGRMYMKGMQDHHVLACAKHFPGHGDTDSDSHKTLPVINHSKERIKEIELYPFQELIKDSLASVMVAHLFIPTLDPTPNRPTTLSSEVVNKMLKHEMKFKGLVFTDALNMKGIANYDEPGDVDVQALVAGNDVLLYPEDVPKAIAKIKIAFENKTLSRKEIHNRVKKILLSKYWSGLGSYQPIKLDHLYEDLNRPKAQALNYKLYEKAITVVKNENNLLPIKVLDTNTFACVSLGNIKNEVFQKTLSGYTSFDAFNADRKHLTEYSLNKIYEQVKDHKVVVVGVMNMSNSRSKRYGISQVQVDFIKKLEAKTNVVVVAFGNPYSGLYLEQFKHVICTYQRNDMTEKIAPQLIFGAIGADGTLPVSATKTLPEGTGEQVKSLKRMGYSLPDNEQMNASYLNEIDTIVAEALGMKATPGCQVLVARNGKIVYEKSFGNLTYQKKKSVSQHTLYDIASITKVAASTQVLMWLRNNGYFHPDDRFSSFLPDMVGTNKEDITFREALAHQAGLFPFIKYWEYTLDSVSKEPSNVYYSSQQDSLYTIPITSNLFVRNDIEDSVWQWTLDYKNINTDTTSNTYPYRYSDLAYYICKRLIKQEFDIDIAEFLAQNFYGPLGMSETTYLPFQTFNKDSIDVAPTEDDDYFRNQLVQGTVHDQGAALIGGVAGHAGLFSNAHDLAKLAQMNLQYGYYGGMRYLDSLVIAEFSAQQYEDNRKGMGWDRAKKSGLGPTSEYSSEKAFGHTGFTGTGMWMDPEYDLVYIFLSNRIYPDASNKLLLKHDIRTRIHDAIYQSIVAYHEDEILTRLQ